MNPKAQKIQDQIDELKLKRDKLRGEHKLICGYCYHDNHKTFREHKKHSPWCHPAGWPCPLGIYVDEYSKAKDGSYTRKH